MTDNERTHHHDVSEHEAGKQSHVMVIRSSPSIQWVLPHLCTNPFIGVPTNLVIIQVNVYEHAQETYPNAELTYWSAMHKWVLEEEP